MAQSVRDIMTWNPTTVRPDTSVVEAAESMASEGVGSLPVVEDDRLVGVLTDRDIALRVVAKGKDPSTTSVGDVASKDPVTVDPEKDLDGALREMARNRVRRLPVVDGGRLVGIVAQADVARELSDAETGRVVEEISE